MKPTPSAIARFERVLPADVRAEPRKMFGHPGAFVAGHMFFGTFNDQLVFRISGAEADAARAAGAEPFAPMEGRVWKDYVAISSETEVPDVTLIGWAKAALERAAELPPKAAKGKRRG